MPLPPEHPVDRPVLPPLMLLTFVVGTVFLCLSGAPVDYTRWFVAGTAVSFACFVALFALYFLGWLLREHELWREGRRQRQQP